MTRSLPPAWTLGLMAACLVAPSHASSADSAQIRLAQSLDGAGVGASPPARLPLPHWTDGELRVLDVAVPGEADRDPSGLQALSPILSDHLNGRPLPQLKEWAYLCGDFEVSGTEPSLESGAIDTLKGCAGSMSAAEKAAVERSLESEGGGLESLFDPGEGRVRRAAGAHEDMRMAGQRAAERLLAHLTAAAMDAGARQQADTDALKARDAAATLKGEARRRAEGKIRSLSDQAADIAVAEAWYRLRGPRPRDAGWRLDSVMRDWWYGSERTRGVPLAGPPPKAGRVVPDRDALLEKVGGRLAANVALGFADLELRPRDWLTDAAHREHDSPPPSTTAALLRLGSLEHAEAWLDLADEVGPGPRDRRLLALRRAEIAVLRDDRKAAIRALLGGASPSSICEDVRKGRGAVPLTSPLHAAGGGVLPTVARNALIPLLAEDEADSRRAACIAEALAGNAGSPDQTTIDLLGLVADWGEFGGGRDERRRGVLSGSPPAAIIELAGRREHAGDLEKGLRLWAKDVLGGEKDEVQVIDWAIVVPTADQDRCSHAALVVGSQAFREEYVGDLIGAEMETADELAYDRWDDDVRECRDELGHHRSGERAAALRTELSETISRCRDLAPGRRDSAAAADSFRACGERRKELRRAVSGRGLRDAERAAETACLDLEAAAPKRRPHLQVLSEVRERLRPTLEAEVRAEFGRALKDEALVAAGGSATSEARDVMDPTIWLTVASVVSEKVRVEGRFWEEQKEAKEHDGDALWGAFLYEQRGAFLPKLVEVPVQAYQIRLEKHGLQDLLTGVLKDNQLWRQLPADAGRENLCEVTTTARLDPALQDSEGFRYFLADWVPTVMKEDRRHWTSDLANAWAAARHEYEGVAGAFSATSFRRVTVPPGLAGRLRAERAAAALSASSDPRYIEATDRTEAFHHLHSSHAPAPHGAPALEPVELELLLDRKQGIELSRWLLSSLLQRRLVAESLVESLVDRSLIEGSVLSSHPAHLAMVLLAVEDAFQFRRYPLVAQLLEDPPRLAVDELGTERFFRLQLRFSNLLVLLIIRQDDFDEVASSVLAGEDPPTEWVEAHRPAARQAYKLYGEAVSVLTRGAMNTVDVTGLMPKGIDLKGAADADPRSYFLVAVSRLAEVLNSVGEHSVVNRLFLETAEAGLVDSPRLLPPGRIAGLLHLLGPGRERQSAAESWSGYLADLRDEDADAFPWTAGATAEHFLSQTRYLFAYADAPGNDAGEKGEQWLRAVRWMAEHSGSRSAALGVLDLSRDVSPSAIERHAADASSTNARLASGMRRASSRLQSADHEQTTRRLAVVEAALRQQVVEAQAAIADASTPSKITDAVAAVSSHLMEGCGRPAVFSDQFCSETSAALWLGVQLLGEGLSLPMDTSRSPMERSALAQEHARRATDIVGDGLPALVVRLVELLPAHPLDDRVVAQVIESTWSKLQKKSGGWLGPHPLPPEAP